MNNTKSNFLNLIIFTCFFVTGLHQAGNSQKIKLENLSFRIESYPKILIPSEFKTYNIIITNKSKSKEAMEHNKPYIKKLLALNSLKYSDIDADLTIELIIHDDLFVKIETDEMKQKFYYYKLRNSLKVYNQKGDFLYNGSVADFYSDPIPVYKKNITNGNENTTDYQNNINSECKLAGINLRKIFEKNIEVERTTFIRLKGDENYEKLISRVTKYIEKDTTFTGEMKKTDSLIFYIDAISKIKPENDKNPELNSRYLYTTQCNQAILYTLLEKFDEADSLMNNLEKINEKEYSLSRQLEFIRDRKKNYFDYLSILELYKKPDYNPYTNKKD